VATIRLKLLKLGAQVRTSVRRIHFAIVLGCPNKNEFELAHVYLQRAPSDQPEPQDAPKTPGLLIAMLTRALMDSHYGKPRWTRITGSRTLSLARSANLVRQPANPIAHPAKMPDNGRVRCPNPCVFEKSRLVLRVIAFQS
jgi:hypothetical protein